MGKITDEIEDLVFVRQLQIAVMSEIKAGWQRVDSVDYATTVTIKKKVYYNIYITETEYRGIFGKRRDDENKN